jgi:hypothetical protein
VVNSGPFEVVNALDFNQIEHLVEVHQITDVFNSTLSATAEKTQHLLLEYELLVSCFEFESRKIKKYFGLRMPFWTNNPKENTLNIRLWTFNGLRNQ